MGADVTRAAIFAQAARKLRADFQELVVLPHRGEKGMEAERLLREFLSERLPRRFGVGSGFAIDPDDSISRQTDVLIYDALHCPIYRASERASIYPADNVAAMVEVKSRLDLGSLREAFASVESIKSLKKHKTGGGPLRTQTWACVFAFSSELNPRTLLKHYCDLIRESGVGYHPDLVVVLDSCALQLVAKPAGTEEWAPIIALEGLGGPAGEGAHFGGGLFHLGERSLDFFFRILLVSLNIFRPFSDFRWADTVPVPRFELEYLFSHTLETDPEKKAAILKRYEREVKATVRTLPPSGEVIELGPGDWPPGDRGR